MNQWNICHKSGRVLFTTNDERTAMNRAKYGWRVKKVDDRYEIAKQHGMSIEFIDWFWENKKASLGSVWFIAMGAMWEGWKGALGDPVGEIVERPCEAELRSFNESVEYVKVTMTKDHSSRVSRAFFDSLNNKGNYEFVCVAEQ